MYFFLLTDGRGWHNCVSDLRKIVEYHHENLIDMVYTRVRRPEFAAVLKHTTENEESSLRGRRHLEPNQKSEGILAEP